MASGLMLRRNNSSDGVVLRANDQRRNTRDRQTMQRTIIKQGYLRKIPNAARLGSSFRRVEQRWFVFGIISQRDPYLEYYENEESIFGSQPLNILFLDTCRHITRNQKTARFSNIFTLVLSDRQLSLVAPTRDVMLEWCRAIEDKLCNLGIIEASGGNNDYIRLPVVHPRPRQPVEPGYMQPRDLLLEQSGRHPIAAVSAWEEQDPETLQNDEISQNDENNFENSDVGFEDENICDESEITGSTEELNLQHNVYMNYAQTSSTTASALTFAQSTSQLDEIETSCFHEINAERRSVSLSDEINIQSLSNDSSAAVQSVSLLEDTITAQSVLLSTEVAISPSEELNAASFISDMRSLPIKPPSYYEAISSSKLPEIPSPTYCDSNLHCVLVPSPSSDGHFSRVASRAQSVYVATPGGSSSVGNVELPAPPPYTQQKVLMKGVNVPLKQSQASKLMEEMNNVSGVVIIVPKNQSHHSIALVECFGKVWICGWNQRTCPTFHSYFHIGDQVLTINDSTVNELRTAKKLLKSFSGKTDVKMLIRRLPLGRVYCVEKENQTTTDSLGIHTINGTAEIGRVEETGMARQIGLDDKAPVVFGVGFCSWWITEVNHHSLNLFFKDNEIKHRLNAIGSHVSFVVQPTQFIIEMKKQMKNIKGYRDFLIH